MRISNRISLTLLLALSLLLNTIGIVRWNAGAPYDTAHKGIETIEEVLQGNIAPFYRHYNGQPPLMDWMLAPVFLLFGVSAYTIHSAGIISGILITLFLYLAGKTIWSHRAGVYASIFGTTSHWVLLETREGTHNIPLVPMLLAVFYCIALIFRSKKIKTKYIAGFIGGVVAGLMGYVYAAGFIFPIVLAITLPLVLLLSLFRKSLISARLPLFLMTLTMAITLVPITRFALHNPESILTRPRSEIGASSPSTLFTRINKHLISMAGAFLYLNTPPFSAWEENTTLNIGPFPVPFPVPFVSPISGMLLLVSLYFMYRNWRQKKSILLQLLLIAFLAIALIPNLLTTGAQPHYRRAVCAMAPLFLLIGWSAASIHEMAFKRSSAAKASWLVLAIAALIYGPYLYFFVVIPSNWFMANYLTAHDQIAPALFARVEANQRVTLVGNTAHMKSLQFYALATPKAQYAFFLVNLDTNIPLSPDLLAKTDTVFYVYSGCEQMTVPGFLPNPTLVKSKSGTEACIFDRPGISEELRKAQVKLPSSKPLWPMFFDQKSPLEEHTPLFGPIFGNEV